MRAAISHAIGLMSTPCKHDSATRRWVSMTSSRVTAAEVRP